MTVTNIHPAATVCPATPGRSERATGDHPRTPAPLADLSRPIQAVVRLRPDAAPTNAHPCFPWAMLVSPDTACGPAGASRPDRVQGYPTHHRGRPGSVAAPTSPGTWSTAA